MPRDKLQNGPISDRSCTDILCCLVFVAFLTGMVFVGGYGFLNGNPRLLLTTWDYDGNPCGMPSKDNNTLNYPYLYFPSVDYNAV